ncbi:hypothetical protein C8J56DRAFT_373409 [Mycena floridula]|nr:hypothetical protein C8J56DRAFT_373409 [Mycena floridula]
MQKTEDMERLQHEEYHEALVDIKESIEAAVDSPTTPIVNDLPLMPQVFHGRDTELTHLVNIFANHENAGHAVIGGQPGVGKSSLAHALLHQEDVVSLYGTNRFYIDCTDASALVDVTSRLKAFLGLSDNLKDHWDLFDSLSNLIGRCLIVLDNLETIWEPSSSRLVFEDFLTQLSDVTTVSLLVTLRGTQRPLGPRWSFSTHVLSPLDPTSAKATFLAISDLPDDPDIDTLLSQIDFLPLPLTIMAHLAQYEPISFLLDRYKEEGTAILSTGNDRTTDLDTSVEISLTSSRITECPSSLLVLRALAQSENGIMRTRVAASVSGISLVQKCISTLIASALVLEDSEGCIRVPSPIRVYLSTHGD